MHSVCEQAVFGAIKDLAVVPWNDKFNARNSQVVMENLALTISFY